jgi:hypothetical protein
MVPDLDPGGSSTLLGSMKVEGGGFRIKVKWVR